jgi:hypothetical protein
MLSGLEYNNGMILSRRGQMTLPQITTLGEISSLQTQVRAAEMLKVNFSYYRREKTSTGRES